MAASAKPNLFLRRPILSSVISIVITLVGALAVAAVLALVAWKIVRDHRRPKGGCGGGRGSCPHARFCPPGAPSAGRR